MKQSELNDRFTIFPYRSETRDDDVNNGGFDLVNNPGDIEKIHEIADFPEMRAFIESLNSPTSRCMTLGCAHGSLNEEIYGYLDISFREIEVAQNERFVAGIDDQLIRWIEDRFPKSDALIQWVRGTTLWEYASFRYFGTAPRLLISMTYHARVQRDAAQTIALIHQFFREGLTFPNTSDLS